MNYNRLSSIIILSLFLLLWGCSERSLNFQVRYAEVSGLTQSDPVYFGQNEIGKVTRVFYTDQADYLVEVSVVPEFFNAVTVDSKFFIDNDPKDAQGKAVIVVLEKRGGKILKNNDIVAGSAQPTILDDMLSVLMRNSTVANEQIQEAIQQLKENLKSTSENMEKDLADTLDELSEQLNMFNDELKKIPDRDEVRQLEKTFEEFSKELNHAQKNVRDHIQHEIIPQLRKELDQIREKLHKEGRDEEIEGIDKKVEELDRA